MLVEIVAAEDRPSDASGAALYQLSPCFAHQPSAKFKRFLVRPWKEARSKTPENRVHASLLKRETIMGD